MKSINMTASRDNMFAILMLWRQGGEREHQRFSGGFGKELKGFQPHK